MVGLYTQTHMELLFKYIGIWNGCEDDSLFGLCIVVRVNRFLELFLLQRCEVGSFPLRVG